VLRSLSKDRDQRHATARDFFDDLSGGGRITVEGGPPIQQTTGTAAMEALPDFGAPAHSPPVHAPYAARPGAPTPTAAVANVPPTLGAHRPAKGGGKGLIIGLGAVGVLLLGAMAVVAARSMGGSDEEPQALNLGGEPTATPTETATASGTGGNTGATTTLAPVETSPPPEPTPAETPSAPPPTTKPNTGTAKPQTGGCDACLTQVNAKNLPAAARSYAACSDEAKKAECKNAARRNAAGDATDAARNGDCKKAAAIIAAAQAMGVSSPRLLKAREGTSCAN
jgi:hypothetical protein